MGDLLEARTYARIDALLERVVARHHARGKRAVEAIPGAGRIDRVDLSADGGTGCGKVGSSPPGSFWGSITATSS